MIKCIIFDWGGVFTHGHLIKDFAQNLSKECKENSQKIEEVFRELEFPYETGKIKPSDFWKEFQKRLNLEMSQKEIQNIFLNSYDINLDMLEYAKKLRKKHKLILLTNNYEDMFDFIKSKYKLEKYFDYLFSSSDVKDKKPNEKMYRRVLDKLKIKLQEIVFIDDKEKNIKGAEKVGFNTIHFTNIKTLKKKLAAML